MKTIKAIAEIERVKMKGKTIKVVRVETEVRILAEAEGYAMVSTSNQAPPFVLLAYQLRDRREA